MHFKNEHKLENTNLKKVHCTSENEETTLFMNKLQKSKNEK